MAARPDKGTRTAIRPRPYTDGVEAPTTLQDIADRVGVTRGTVSLALSGKGRMSAETRERIRSAARDMNYVANTVARNLRASRSGSVGLYIPDNPLSYPYYMDVVYGAVKEAQQAGMLVTVLPSEEGRDPRFEDHLDGFIVMDPEDGDPMAERLLTGRRPVVSGEAVPEGTRAPWAVVTSDNRSGIAQVVDHVIGRGARTVLAVLPPPNAAWVREIAEGFEASIARHDAHGTRTELAPDLTADAIGNQIVQAVRSRPDIDAVICAAEGAAVIALSALQADGRQVGEDLLLASYLDSGALRVSTPSVTALDLQPRRIGAACMAALLDSLGGTRPDEPVRVDVAPVLHVRASTAPLTRVKGG